MFNITEKTIKIGQYEITIETGRIARQAGGSVLVTCGGTQLLVTATAAKDSTKELSFFPLSVDYLEKMYSTGRIQADILKEKQNLQIEKFLLAV